MKKLILSAIFLTASLSITAQVLLTENWNGLTSGNLGTDVTGATPGQNGWLILNGTAANFQIATVDAVHGQSLTITSGAGAPPTSGANTNNRFAFKEFTPPAAAIGNNVLKVDFELYTGPATGKGRASSALYDASNGIVGAFYDYETKTIKGYLRLTPTAGATAGTAAFYSVNLGTQTFAPNTWVKVRYYYNVTTGEYGFNYPGGAYTFGLAQVGTTYTLSPNLAPVEHDFYNTTLALNTVANVTSVDNLVVEYTTLAAALSTQDIKPAQLALSIYPNPTSDILNIQTDEKIKSATIFDMAGRKIAVKVSDNKVDVKNLEAGSYLISIETSKGTSTEKFIKK